MTRDDIKRMAKAGEVDQLWTLFDALKNQRDQAEATSRAYLQHVTELRAVGDKAVPAISKAKVAVGAKPDLEAALAENLAVRRKTEL